MPAKWFVCPDGEVIEIEKCITECRMDEPCMATPVAITLGYNRPPPKIPRMSASQGLTGVRQKYLELTTFFVVNPQNRADSIMGTAAHTRLEEGASGDRFVSEQYFKNAYTSCFIDLYERHTRILWDYKTWGAFKIKKALGLVKARVPSGEFYKVNGKNFKKGDPKMMDVWTRDPEQVDLYDVELQMNMERILIQRTLPVKQMKVQAIVKEPLWSVAKHGIDRKLYTFDVKRLDDERVIEVYKNKTEALREAFRTGEVPDYCTEAERWGGRKCERFCEVREACNPPWLNPEVESVDPQELF